MRFKLTGAALLATALSASGVTAQQIEWQQTIDLPRGLNMPAGLTLDILGIAPGDTFEEARAKIKAIAPEGAEDVPVLTPTQRRSGVSAAPDYLESNTEMYMPTANGPEIEISYPSRITLERELKGAGGIDDNLSVDFSAPSSGHQAILISRTIKYYSEADQPRISEIVASLSAKFGAVVEVEGGGSTYRKYRWQYADGQPVTRTGMLDCGPWVNADLEEQKLDSINRDGLCDVMLELHVGLGISEDHASRLEFKLADNERGKQALGADYAFFWKYIEQVQSKAGAAPAL